MPKITEDTLNYVMWVYFAVFGVAAYFNQRFMYHLRTIHPETWKALGSPGFLNSTMQNSWATVRFLVVKRGYRDLDDPRLAFYGNAARIGLIAICSFLVGFFALMMVGQAQNGVWQQPIKATHPLNGTGAVMLACFVAGVVAGGLFFKRLRTKHLATWEELGRPSLLNLSIRNGRNPRQFITSGAYEKLGDSWLTLYGRMAWLTWVGFGILVLAVLLGFLHT